MPGNASGVKKNTNFKWDFSIIRDYNYYFEEYVRRYGNAGHGPMEHRRDYFVFGDFIIASLGNGKANITFEVSEEVNAYSRGQKGVCKNMDEKSIFRDKSQCKFFEYLLDIMFPLPFEKLKQGARETRQFKDPIQFRGESGFLYRFMELEYVRDIEPGIVLIQSEMRADRVVIDNSNARGLELDYKAKGEYIFNYQMGYFETATIDITSLTITEYNLVKKHIDSSLIKRHYEACFFSIDEE